MKTIYQEINRRKEHYTELDVIDIYFILIIFNSQLQKK